MMSTSVVSGLVKHCSLSSLIAHYTFHISGCLYAGLETRLKDVLGLKM